MASETVMKYSQLGPYGTSNCGLAKKICSVDRPNFKTVCHPSTWGRGG